MQTTTISGSTTSGWNVTVMPSQISSNGPVTSIFGVGVKVPKGVADGHVETLTVRASCQMSVFTPTVDTDTSQITVKNTSPVSEWVVRITDPRPDEVFKTDGLTINGTASYNLGTITKVEVKVCTGPWTVATGTTDWTIDYDCSYLDDGEHTIYARARSGDELSPTTEITVIQQRTGPASPDDPQNPSGGGDGRDYTWIAIVAVIVLVAAGAAYYMYRRRSLHETEYRMRYLEEIT